MLKNLHALVTTSKHAEVIIFQGTIFTVIVLIVLLIALAKQVHERKDGKEKRG